MTSSPLWRGGGKIFPSSPDENFSHKVNRKMYRAGMASILSQLVREERLTVIDALTVDQPKTKLLTEKLKAMGLTEVLIITDLPDENLYLSSRNLPERAGSRGAPRGPGEPGAVPQGPAHPGAVKHLEEALA